MDNDNWLPWAVAIFLLFCAAYFAVAETAIASASRNKIKLASERGDSRADKALFVIDHFDKAISTLLICTNIVHITAATVVTVAVNKTFGLGAVTVSTLLTTIAVFFFGEMLPKSIAKKYAERFSLSTAGTLIFFMKVFSPLSSFLTKIGQAFANRTKGDAEISVTEDELYDIIEDMTEDGSIDEDEGDLISSAIEFDDKTVGSIMTPKRRIVAVDIKEKPEKIIEELREQSHSRIPVYDGDIDHIVGMLQIREFIKAYLKNKNVDISTLLTPPLYVQRSMAIDELLKSMSEHKFSVCVVQDMQNRTVGVISVEDILEELVGEIWDEEDKGGSSC